MQDEYLSFTNQLVEAGLFVRTAAPGIFGRSDTFERVATAVDRVITNEALSQGAREMFFPPVLPREILRRTGYMENFPHLCGSIHSFNGSEQQHAELLAAVSEGHDWTPWLKETDLALCPAACYPLYPTLAGQLPEGGHHVTLWSYVFRREPSPDPARLQMFRMREDIRVGTPEQGQQWRQHWMDQGLALLTELQLDVRLDVANDPFFGRGGRFMGKSQREQELKFELFVPITSAEKPTAVASFNYHQEHFTKTFEIVRSNGEPAHTACIGFGLERMALALLKKHGLALREWPATVKGKLGL